MNILFNRRKPASRRPSAIADEAWRLRSQYPVREDFFASANVVVRKREVVAASVISPNSDNLSRFPWDRHPPGSSSKFASLNRLHLAVSKFPVDKSRNHRDR